MHSLLLQITDPFGTGKIVLFQVHYDKEYHLFELVPYIITGAFAVSDASVSRHPRHGSYSCMQGFFGAVATYFNIKFQTFRKSSALGKYPVIEVLGIMLITALMNYWNPFGRMGLNEFAANLFNECSEKDDNGGLCA